MHGTILELRTPTPRKATALLREQLQAEAISLFGDRVHIVTQAPDRAAAQAEGILAGAGLELSGIRPIEPTLEDVFVAVLAKEERG
jgi:ABC-2 type transport system ATP-binding protein